VRETKEGLMILASKESVREWTEKGVWGKKTLIDYFKENAAKSPDMV
jgi:non-ribosomal peptide synthetase component E (peptide arylation enzyme)